MHSKQGSCLPATSHQQDAQKAVEAVPRWLVGLLEDQRLSHPQWNETAHGQIQESFPHLRPPPVLRPIRHRRPSQPNSQPRPIHVRVYVPSTAIVPTQILARLLHVVNRRTIHRDLRTLWTRRIVPDSTPQILVGEDRLAIDEYHPHPFLRVRLRVTRSQRISYAVPSSHLRQTTPNTRRTTRCAEPRGLHMEPVYYRVPWYLWREPAQCSYILRNHRPPAFLLAELD